MTDTPELSIGGGWAGAKALMYPTREPPAVRTEKPRAGRKRHHEGGGGGAAPPRRDRPPEPIADGSGERQRGTHRGVDDREDRHGCGRPDRGDREERDERGRHDRPERV